MLWILLALTIIVSFFSIQEIYAQDEDNPIYASPQTGLGYCERSISPEIWFENADVVFYGIPITKESIDDSDTIKIEIDALEIYKGNIKGINSIYATKENTASVLSLFGDPFFELNKGYVVYAKYSDETLRIMYGSCLEPISFRIDHSDRFKVLPDSVLNLDAGMESPKAYKEYLKKLDVLKESSDKPSPREQLAVGIRYMDVFCSNDFVLLFKWSSNSPACIKPQSVEKLVERGWGVPKDETMFLVIATQCETAFTIQYNDPSKYKESKIIRTIRDALSETNWTSVFEDYMYLWQYIDFWIDKPDNEGKTTVSVEGSYRESGNELSKEGYRKIIEALQSMEGVTNVQPHGVVCQ